MRDGKCPKPEGRQGKWIVWTPTDIEAARIALGLELAQAP